MQHRVDTLHLKVRSPAGYDGPAARLAERFTRDVLEQFSQIVEATSPGRAVLIRRLAARWSLSAAEMTDPATVMSCAADLADSVAAGMSDTVVTFEDEAAWLAAYLRARAAGAAGAWFHSAWHTAEDGGSPLPRETVAAALSRLQATGELGVVLASLPPGTLTAVRAVLDTGPKVVRQAHDRRQPAPPDGRPIEPPAVPEQAAQGRGESAPTDAPPNVLPPAVSRRDVRDEALPGHAAAAGAGPAGAHPVSPPAIDDVEARLIAAVAAAAHRTDEEAHRRLAPSSPSMPATRFGGLFYLLARALELGIGESLWKVCLPEGLILAHAVAALLGPDAAGDPAPALFGGVTMGELLACPTVSAEQQAVVCVELLAATAAALPHYGVAPAPEVFLDLVASLAGRMLVASGLGPFALFAWPAPDARSAAAGVAAFLSVWPGSFPPPQARDVLLRLDTRRRLRPASGAVARTGPLLPAAPNAPAIALLAQICGMMAELFAVRAADAGASDLVSRYLAIPGHITLALEAMTIVLPMASIDLAVRRAALDRDAGWVPWLGRSVRIEFAPQGEGEVI